MYVSYDGSVAVGGNVVACRAWEIGYSVVDFGIEEEHRVPSRASVVGSCRVWRSRIGTIPGTICSADDCTGDVGATVCACRCGCRR